MHNLNWFGVFGRPDRLVFYGFCSGCLADFVDYYRNNQIDEVQVLLV